MLIWKVTGLPAEHVQLGNWPRRQVEQTIANDDNPRTGPVFAADVL